MDPEPITTEPTTDPEPPNAASVAAGPSQVPGSPAAGGRRGTMVRRAAIALALVLAFSVGIGVGGLAVSALGTARTSTPAPTGSAAATDFGLIREAWDTLHTKYVGASELDDRALIYGAINGMTDAVGDTGHTSFLTPEERAARSSDLSGKYVGIGVRIDTAKDGLPLIVGVFPKSPAETAGLAVGDEIVAVDGKTTTGHTIADIVDWVRGEAGSPVKVAVKPGATGKPRNVTMVRADVAVVPVSWTLVPGTRTALIRLDQFSSGAANDLKKSIAAAREAGANRLILDLRGNPGGYVNEADAVASQFLKSGVVFIEKAADGHKTTHPVAAGGVATDLPLVVLVDGGTASSSEIVSGALQDAGRAQIVGIKTFGTGTVLGEFPLSDGSALRVGTVEWLTPEGRRIWHRGITPDAVVERASDVAPLSPDAVRKLTPAQVDKLGDPQLARALSLVTAETTSSGG
ncbi:MAG: S41 family peptidase [Chloroflexota bacterium]